MKTISLLLGLSFSALVQAAPAVKPLSLESVLKSTLTHHPRIMQVRSIQQQAQGSMTQAEGAFDWEVEQTSFARTSGFYDGWLLDQSMSRRLPFANAEIEAGYRVSDGIFPVYEDINRTLSGGEAKISAAFSLLRDREIDKNRTALKLAETEIDMADQSQALIINDLLLDASLQFLSWQRSARKAEVYANLYDLATARKNAIDQKISAGEVARITQTEFEVTVLQRQADLLAIQQKLENDALGLGFYYRDNNGKPKMVHQHYQVEKSLTPALAQLPQPVVLTRALNAHPDLRKLEFAMQQADAKVKLNRNALLPELKAKVTLANDIGSGSETLDGFESYVGLEFSVPLGQRAAKGKLARSRAKLTELSAKYTEKRERLSMKLEQTMLARTNLMRMRDLREKQAQVAERLMHEEFLRFEAGDSDLFLLNTREANYAKATLAAIDADIDVLAQHFVILSGSALLEQRLQN